jgi:hypothetical protein
MMAHSNKPQPDYSPYRADCEVWDGMSQEQRYWEEVLEEEGARHDQYDGFDTGDLNYPAAWDEDELDGPVTVPDPAPVVDGAPAPVVDADEDNILF